ncbi:MAG: nucleoside phosphorylase [Acidimicrobiia bacterium]
MAFPQFAEKHDHEGFINPSTMRDWRAERRMLPDRAPESAILLYQNALYEAAIGVDRASPVGGRGLYEKLFTLDRTDGRVGVVGGFGIGAPVAAIVVEELISIGVERILSIGTAGALQPDLAPGEIVLCTDAVRDKGVSHHYAPSERAAAADTALSQAWARSISDTNLRWQRGTSWTIEHPYRETVAEARHYQTAGVLCVEMEAAALFTVGAYRRTPLACAFCISDSLTDAEWNPQFDHPDLARNLLTLYGAAVDTLIA